MFQKPSFIISPTPGDGGNWDLDFAMQSAVMKQDVLNSIVRNKNVNFVKHIRRAAKDSFTRFGIMEIGYAADWRNPQKEIPQLNSWEDENVPEEKIKVVKNADLPISERFYVKRINPKRFRVSVSEAMDLNDHEWCGYYDFVYASELKKTEGINWPKGFSGGMVGADFSNGILGDSFDRGNRSDLMRGLFDGTVCKIWHIWDMVSNQRLLYLDEWFDEPLWSGDIERLPLIDLRWDEDTEGFYPVPPCFQWISPQDEINEAREQTRSYRRRFTRKFQYTGGIDDLEVEKFVSGGDGVLIKVGQANAISPIQNPEQGQTTENALLLAKDDFNVISGTSAEARNQATERETATAAKIVDARAAIRESADQMDFSTFIEQIGAELLITAQERLVEGLWIKDSSGAVMDPNPLAQAKGPVFKYIQAQDLRDGYDHEISVNVENMTPAAMAAHNQSFAQFLTYVHNFPEIALDPDLIREAAYRCGYRNEKIISKMQKTALMIMAEKAAQAGATGGSGVQQDQGQNANNIAAKHIQAINPNGASQMEQKSLETVR